MREQLELKHLAPYLPYGLKVRNGSDTFEIIAMNKGAVFFKGGLLVIEDIKPILRPLSYLTKEIEHNGERFVPINFFIGDDSDDIMNAYYSDGHLETISYNLIIHLLSWHLDIFGLINKGLAISYEEAGL